MHALTKMLCVQFTCLEFLTLNLCCRHCSLVDISYFYLLVLSFYLCVSFIMTGFQVCKYFLEAVEKKQYGWFWVCPNGGKDCHYRHALPPGYVLKSQMKALLEEAADKVPIEEEIEAQVSLNANRSVLWR